MKNKILILFFLLSASICFSQQKATWEDLSKVEFTEKYFSKYNEYFLHPKFLPSVKELEGKQITISGYFLNIDPRGKIYILSKGPMSSCFFCGQGGPETIVELQFTNKANFKTDDMVGITGILELNKDDVDHFNYILKGCKGKLIE